MSDAQIGMQGGRGISSGPCAPRASDAGTDAVEVAALPPDSPGQSLLFCQRCGFGLSGDRRQCPRCGAPCCIGCGES